MFDYDGVIADSFDTFFDSFIEACREHGYGSQMPGREAFLRLFDTNLFEGMDRAGIARMAVGPILKTMTEKVEERNLICRLFPGMPEALERLAREHRLYVITSNVGATVSRFLREAGVSCVEEVIGNEKEKSKVRKIRAVMERWPEARPYYIGDTAGDMIEGREAGARTVGAAWGWHGAERLTQTEPDCLAWTPGELTDVLLRD